VCVCVCVCVCVLFSVSPLTKTPLIYYIYAVFGFSSLLMICLSCCYYVSGYQERKQNPRETVSGTKS
jgi:predicted membrane channel-forming protein YqfA (hemolysin III family)